MSRNRSLWLLSLWLLVGAAQTVHAQFVQPFIDPSQMDMDFQWFEPLYGEDPDLPEPHLGPFFTYSRANLNISRPNESPARENGDWAWGNRFEFGYMTDEHGGWSFTTWGVDSPSEFVVIENIDRNGVVITDLLGNPIGPLTSTVNDMEFYGFEANRTWRLPHHFRTLAIEPYVGARFIRVSDFYLRQTFVAERETADPIGPANAVIPLVQRDTYTSANTDHANDVFGGQFGVRFVGRRGRWRLMTDVRGMAFNNFQDSEELLELEITERTDLATYDADGLLVAVAEGTPVLEQDEILSGGDANTFVWGGELRMEAAFDFTRHVALVFGLDVTILADGIGRGVLGTDESFTMAGLTVGFNLNH